ncbi:MAG: type IV pilus assembly protein PilM [Patescibacteria group bacterium]|jgi:type IV pilus assembly protein PilM
MSIFTPKKQAFGIEISDASIKVLQLKKGGKFYKLVGYNVLKIPQGIVVSGEIKDSKLLASYIQKATNSAKPKKIFISNVVCSLPENKTFVRILEIPQMSKEELSEGIKWQAEQYIPLPIDTVYLDWQIIETIDSRQRILVAAAPKKIVDSYINVLKIARLKPQVLDLEEAAEARALIPENQKEASLIVDIGATKTVFFVQDRKIVPFASNTQEVCGNKFTENISKALKINIENAEAKKAACCSPDLSNEEKTLLQSIYPLFDSLATQIIKIIGYYQNHFKSANPINNIILCGGGANISGIVPHLTLKLKMKISIANPLTNLPVKKSLPINNQDLLSLTTVIGLGIRGAEIVKYSK